MYSFTVRKQNKKSSLKSCTYLEAKLQSPLSTDDVYVNEFINTVNFLSQNNIELQNGLNEAFLKIKAIYPKYY